MPCSGSSGAAPAAPGPGGLSSPITNIGLTCVSNYILFTLILIQWLTDKSSKVRFTTKFAPWIFITLNKQWTIYPLDLILIQSKCFLAYFWSGDAWYYQQWSGGSRAGAGVGSGWLGLCKWFMYVLLLLSHVRTIIMKIGPDCVQNNLSSNTNCDGRPIKCMK